MKRLFLYGLACTLLTSAGGGTSSPRAPLQPAPAAPGYKPSFQDFNGVTNDAMPADLMKQLRIGWVRAPFYWSDIEGGQKGAYDWQKTDGIVASVHGKGAEVLPIFLGTPIWASSVPGQWGKVPPKNVSDWTGFVEQAVSHYSAAPFNLKYFQLWNEPTEPNFWTGTVQDFIDRVYLPAAQIVRKHGCYTVLAGWDGSFDGLNALLAYHEAWRSTDIIDLHYKDASWWPRLYQLWIATGKCRGLWQTEVGWTTNPTLLHDLYSQSFTWAATSGGWKDRDQYKLFWYRAGGDPRSITQAGPQGKLVLTVNGQQLAALAPTLP